MINGRPEMGRLRLTQAAPHRALPHKPDVTARTTASRLTILDRRRQLPASDIRAASRQPAGTPSTVELPGFEGLDGR